MRSRLAALLILALPLVAAETAWIVDEAGKQIAEVDLGSGTIVSRVELPFTPDRAKLAPDGRTLLVLDQGEANVGFWVAEIRPKTKANAAVVREGKLVAANEIGWGLAESAISADGGTAWVLTTGYESNKAAERKPSELVKIDLRTGAVAGRLELDAAAAAFAAYEASGTGVIYSPAYPKKKPAPLPARLTFVDLASLEAKQSIDLTGVNIQRPMAAGSLLYVLDANPKAAGRLTVIDPKARAVVETIPVGSEAVLGGSDESGRLYVLSQAADRKSGRVSLVNGAEIVADYGAVAAPKMARVSADGKRLYLLGWKEFSIVDLVKGEGGAVVEQARNPFAVLGTSDGSRAFTVNMDGDQCCRITAFDTTASPPRRLTTFLGGSKGERIGQGLAAAALSVASYQAGKSIAESTGSNTFYYSIYAPTSRGAARGPLAFGPGEKKVYFVDTQTSDVTVVDVATGERLRTLDAGFGLQEVIPLHDAGVIVGVADSALTMVDVKTDEVSGSIELGGGVTDAVLTPDGKRLIVFGKERFIVLDATTAKEIARAQGLKQPVQLILN